MINDPDHAEKFKAFIAQAHKAGLLADALLARSSRDAKAVWDVRDGHKLTQIMPRMINFDISLDIGRMGSFVQSCRAALHTAFPARRTLFFGHARDGNLHLVVASPAADKSSAENEIHQIVYALVRTMDGSISAAHGIGTLKRDCLAHSRSKEKLALMTAIKRAVDPKGILNPGKRI